MKLSVPYRQSLQELPGLYRARQVRSAVETPAFLLQPAYSGISF